MTPRRLLPVLALAAALLAPAAAQAAAPGVNVTDIGYDGVPAGGWQNVTDSGAKQIRGFVNWQNVRGASRDYEMQRYRLFADQAKARGLRVLLTVTGTAGAMPSTPADYAAVAGDIATELRGKGVDYEVWNEEDENGFWLNGPQPAAYTALLKAAYPAIKNADPSATVLVGGLVANNFDFLEQLYANGAKGSFDAVGVHTDTACLTTDPREYYREPSGRIGRYSFTGYREVRATMLAHGDDKPVWMTELGWSTTPNVCAVGSRAGTKPGGVPEAQQADFLTKAYGCLANDPYVTQAAWFNLHDLDARGDLGLVQGDLFRKPAFFAFQRASSATPIPCGGTVDEAAPQITFLAPTEG